MEDDGALGPPTKLDPVAEPGPEGPGLGVPVPPKLELYTGSQFTVEALATSGRVPWNRGSASQ